MSKIIHFPLQSDQFSHQFGIKSLAPGQDILERTDEFEAEIKLKEILLSEDPQYYACSTPESVLAEEEVSIMLTGEPDKLIETSKKNPRRSRHSEWRFFTRASDHCRDRLLS